MNEDPNWPLLAKDGSICAYKWIISIDRDTSHIRIHEVILIQISFQGNQIFDEGKFRIDI